MMRTSVIRQLPRQILPVLSQTSLSIRQYNFASESYANSFQNLPVMDSEPIRAASVEYIRNHDIKQWYEDPIQTVLNGEIISGGVEVTTVNAFNEENGLMIHSPAETVDQVITHMQTFKPKHTDLREPLRAIEQELLTTYAPILVGNQAIDFKKQDGITEMEESVEANTVERRLNDLLFQDEQAGKIEISRNPALCGCVSNFTNFLDLFRKTVRNLELGVPVVVLSRSNTSQHTYRWFQILRDLLAKHGVEAGMLTHASCDITQQRRIMSANQASPLYFTGSRPVSAAIKEVCPKLMSSTGGPNTMVSDHWSTNVGEAVRMSAAIENSGQCTALRHVIAPQVSAQDIETAFSSTEVVDGPADALANSAFASVFKQQEFNLDAGYTSHPDLPMAYKITNNGELPPPDLDEKWRQLYVDVTSVDNTTLQDPTFLQKTSEWLVEHQPISLAVNGADLPAAYTLMAPLFEQTCMVVYTVGSEDQPALTAQARPQDAEIFGEFPPRSQLTTYTKFPVVGPSSTPGYDSYYTEEYLCAQAGEASPAALAYCDVLINQVSQQKVRGYLKVMLNYLMEAAQGPREGHGARTSLWGLQRPPLNDSGLTIIRASTQTNLDDLSVSLLPFLATSARGQVRISIDPENEQLYEALSKVSGAVGNPVELLAETDTEFKANPQTHSAWNLIEPEPCDFSLVGHHISVLFPLGHIKCTKSNDEDFVNYFTQSRKWLRVVGL